MLEAPEEVVPIARAEMDRALAHLSLEMAKIRTGKAASNLLDSIMIDFYGTPTPINQVANVSVADARTITIQPWESKQIPPIERAIMEANIGLNPQNDGVLIRLTVPPLTEERRKEMVKKSRLVGEESKVGVRSARRDAIENVRKAVKDGFPEDLGKRLESELDGLTKIFVDKIDKAMESKEKDIMTV